MCMSVSAWVAAQMERNSLQHAMPCSDSRHSLTRNAHRQQTSELTDNRHRLVQLTTASELPDNRLASHVSCFRRASFLFATEAGVPLEVGPSLEEEEDAAFSTSAVEETLEVAVSFEEDEEDEGFKLGVRAVEEVGLLSALLESCASRAPALSLLSRMTRGREGTFTHTARSRAGNTRTRHRHARTQSHPRRVSRHVTPHTTHDTRHTRTQRTGTGKEQVCTGKQAISLALSLSRARSLSVHIHLQ